MLYSTLTVLLGIAASAVGFLTPAPAGPYQVQLTTGQLVDHSRDNRALMLSIFQPAKCTSTKGAKYMPKKTANFQGPFLEAIYDLTVDLSPIFRAAQLPVCAGDACTLVEDLPVLLFSPGYSIPRLYYSVLASAIASEGFVVISIDHPGDANAITYTDGHVTYNNDTTQDLTSPEVLGQIPKRISDFSFVIDSLSNITAMEKLLPHHGARSLPTDRVAMFGHSMGGVASVLAAAQDSRIKAAINWDGSFLVEPPASGVSRPVLLMTHGTADASFPATWPLLNGQKLWVNVADTQHATFSDVPTLLEAAGQDPAALADVLGTIAPTKMRKILVAYTTAWMKGVFKGKKLTPSQSFPEVSVEKEQLS